MSHPPYHLRINKAIDRLSFIEAIKRLDRLATLSEYTYYGLGGPYLEDFRLMYELCPEIKLVSIEIREDVCRRQAFHLPCGTLRLENANISDFLSRYESNDEKSIFWLDYTDLKFSNYTDFMALLGKVPESSMVKITLRAEPKDFSDGPKDQVGAGAARFKQQFQAIMPDAANDPPRGFEDFAFLLQEMVQVTAQQALPAASSLMFLPVTSFHYADGARMFTLTGVVSKLGTVDTTKNAFGDLRFSNFAWTKPKLIDVPFLSTKERLHLQKHLPCTKNPGPTLYNALGHMIDEDQERSEAKLEQYADYHLYSPYFIRAVP